MTITEEQKALATDATVLCVRLRAAGLLATAQRMEAVVRMIGWEMAGDISGCIKAEAREAEKARRARK